jgi:hypothetical protein
MRTQAGSNTEPDAGRAAGRVALAGFRRVALRLAVTITAAIALALTLALGQAVITLSDAGRPR